MCGTISLQDVAASEYIRKEITTMRRYEPPYNGKRFILNKNTLEAHDLDHEQSSCRIAEIKNEHVHSCDSYSEAELYSIMVLQQKCNGCAYCMPEKNNG